MTSSGQTKQDEILDKPDEKPRLKKESAKKEKKIAMTMQRSLQNKDAEKEMAKLEEV